MTRCVRAGRRARGRGRKVLSLVASMLVGGCCIDRCSTDAAVGLWGWGAGVRTGGGFDAGDVSAVVHFRASAPARQVP